MDDEFASDISIATLRPLREHGPADFTRRHDVARRHGIAYQHAVARRHHAAQSSAGESPTRSRPGVSA